jgi:hypothetical protein
MKFDRIPVLTHFSFDPGLTIVWFYNVEMTQFAANVSTVLADAWKACRDAEVLLESPPAMAGVHIAEALGEHQALTIKKHLDKPALGIPYMRIFTMPWTKSVHEAIASTTSIKTRLQDFRVSPPIL